MNNLPTLEEQVEDWFVNPLKKALPEQSELENRKHAFKQALIIAEQRGMHRMVEGKETPNYFDTTV